MANTPSVSVLEVVPAMRTVCGNEVVRRLGAGFGRRCPCTLRLSCVAITAWSNKLVAALASPYTTV